MAKPDRSQDGGDLAPAVIGLGVLTDETALRSFALAIGELHASFVRRYEKLLEDVGGDPDEAVKASLASLVQQGAINNDERLQLGRILDQVGNKGDPAEINAQIHATHEALIDSDANPIAIAISGIAVGSIAGGGETTATRPLPKQEEGESGFGGGGGGRGISVKGDMAGGIIGAIFGFAAGNVVGGIIGAAGGAVAGSAHTPR